MSAENVDIVFVLDKSKSMQPCFDQLRSNLQSLIDSLGNSVYKLRFGLVAQSCTLYEGGGGLFSSEFLNYNSLGDLYKGSEQSRDSFFTKDAGIFRDALATLEPEGNEDMIIALDIAADFPFGHLSNTKRVIALYSDEPIEDQIPESRLAKFDELLQKIMDRRISLYAAIPDSEYMRKLDMLENAEITPVSGYDGLANLDFQQLLTQMGESITVSVLQSIEKEEEYKKALFDQDSWGVGKGDLTGE